MVKIILISGKAGSGKTTLAQALCLLLMKKNFSVLHTTFAKPLYLMHDKVLSVLTDVGMSVEKKDRRLLQLLGTEWGRQTIGENIWVSYLANFVEKWEAGFKSQQTRYVIVSDLRFVNEFESFPDALRIRLECSEEERRGRADSFPKDTFHQSEVNLDLFAEMGEFDLYFNTSKKDGKDVEWCTTSIYETLMTDNWKHNRNEQGVS